MNLALGFGLQKVAIAALLNPEPPDLPADYWQENDTENYFFEEGTENILTLEDL